MREILFRGRRVDRESNGRFVEGWLFMYEGSLCIQTLAESKYGEFIFQVDPETVGQYTGQTDKNGTKIFEGDIIKVFNTWMEEYIIGKVFFRNEEFQIMATDGFWWHNWVGHPAEVIGNTYESQ